MVTKTPPGPLLLGYCNPSNDNDSHRRCRGQYDGRPCACEREGCPCREARTKANGAALLIQLQHDAESVDLSGAILSGVTEGDLEQVRLFAAALQHDDPDAALDVLSREQGPHGNATTMSLEQALVLQQQRSPATVVQHHATAPDQDIAATRWLTVTGERWTWEADAAAELMLQPGDCPMCAGAWDAHVFHDDGRVACP